MIKRINTYVFDSCFKTQNSGYFKNLLYTCLILKAIVWLYNASLFFEQPVISYIEQRFINVYSYPAFTLFTSNNAFVTGASFTLLVFLLSIMQLLLRSGFMIVDVVLWLLVLNIHMYTYSTLSGGDALLNNLLFFNVFLIKKPIKGNSFYTICRIAAHNFSYVALLLQVCLVYVFSALAKWYDADWQSGEAIWIVSSAPQYSRNILVENAALLFYPSLVLSYFVLLYQTLFPIFVFIKSLKRWFLPIGIAMHLYIALVMGLFFFGLIMALVYILFYDFNSVKNK